MLTSMYLPGEHTELTPALLADLLATEPDDHDDDREGQPAGPPDDDPDDDWDWDAGPGKPGC